MSGIPTRLELPTDHKTTLKTNLTKGVLPIEIPFDLTQKIKKLITEENLTLYMLLMGGFGLVLSKYSRQEDFVLGTPLAGRRFAEIEQLIGLFINTLAIRINADKNLTIKKYLENVRETCLEAYEHQDVPFEKLVEEIQPARTLSHTPIFQVTFALQNLPKLNFSSEVKSDSNDSGSKKFSVKFAETTTNKAKFEITVALTEINNTIAGEIEYRSDLFEEKTIRQMFDHYLNVLSVITEDK